MDGVIVLNCIKVRNEVNELGYLFFPKGHNKKLKENYPGYSFYWVPEENFDKPFFENCAIHCQSVEQAIRMAKHFPEID